MKYFAAAFGVSLVALAVLLQLVSVANTGERGLVQPLLGRFTPSLTSIDVSSAALQAVIGTAVVGASAIVALLVAVAALRASQTSNVLSDPDYVLSHNAYSAYRKYGFLFGSLIASYRTYRHEMELASYVAAPAAVGAAEVKGPPNSAVPVAPVVPAASGPLVAPKPRWDSILAELRALLLDTAFQVAALEAAKILEVDGRDENQHRLRKAFANALSALEQQADRDSARMSAEHSLTVLLAQASLLDVELRRGLDAVKALELPSRPSVEGGRLLHYLRRWMHEIGELQVGEDFEFAARANAFAGEEFGAMFGKASWQEVFDGLLEEVFIRNAGWKSSLCVDPFENGLHRAMTIAAVCGDHTTVMQLRERAKAFAASQGLTPRLVVVRNKASVPPPEAGTFYIFHVTRKTLPLLFGKSGIGYGDALDRHTRGCVIVDGLRSAHIADIEAEMARLAKAAADAARVADATERPATKAKCIDCLPCEVCGNCRTCGNCKNKSPRRLDIFVNVLTRAAYCSGREVELGSTIVRVERESSHLTADGTRGIDFIERDETPAAEGPKVAWVGLDYRQLGVEPPSVLDDWSSEMWSVFHDFGASVSDEVRALTNL